MFHPYLHRILSSFSKNCSLTCITLLSVVVLVGSCSREKADTEPVNFDPELQQLNSEEAASEAAQIRSNTQVELENGLELSLWASEKLLGDPIAIHMDNQGRALVTVTNRSNNSEFDIRGVDDSWRIESMKWETVEDRREFLHSELAPEKSNQNTWIPDRNGDDSHDWRDLAVIKEEVWRIEDTSGDGVADQSRLYIRDFNSEVTDVAGAVLTYKEDVFVGVGPDMWRLRDTDNDGMADIKESISNGYNVHIGFSGHGMSGLKIGPDGRIYWGIGDMGFNIVDKEGIRWYSPNKGAILRSEPDGSNFEVFASGLRNTHEFDFDKYGNLISVDNDGDHPGEHERLVYLINGSDSGWRINWQFGKYGDPKNNEYKVWMDEEYYKPRFEGQAAHILPPIAAYHAGPAGFAYNPGTALSDEWKDHFFVMSFRGSVANSPIYAFTLEEKGASFELETDRDIVTGVLAVGFDFGPDGSLYMTDWIEGWNKNEMGRVWKLDTSGESYSEIRLETKELLAEDFSGRSVTELRLLLEHQDMRVRQKAQFEMVDRSASAELLNAIVNSSNQLARIHGIWGLAQIGRENPKAVEPLIRFLNDEDSEIQAQSAKMLGDVRYKPAAESLIPLLSDENARVRLFATEALGRIGYENAVQPIVQLLEANNDEEVYLRHAGAIALARIGNAETVTRLSDHPSRAVRIAAVVALKRMGNPGITQFLDDEDEYIVTNAARAISDDLFIDDAIPELASLLNQTSFTNEPLIRRIINANLYSGTGEDAHRLAEFTLKENVPVKLRVEALNTLEYWHEPSIFDRVTGRHRGPVSNHQSDAQDAITGIMETHFQSDHEPVKVALLNAIGNIGVQQAADQILSLVHDDPSSNVRSTSLQALHDLDYDALDEIIAASLEDTSLPVRMKALDVLVDSDLSSETKVALFTTVIEEGSAVEKKEAYDALSRVEAPGAKALLLDEMNRLMEGEIDRTIRLDLILAVENSESEELQKVLEKYKTNKPQNPIAVFQETLYGGDAGNGAEIFYSDVSAQCTRCHMVDGYGAEVGPDLTSVGNRLSREELLLSMIAPSAQPSSGYSSMTVTLKSGETISGIYFDETDDELILSIRGEKETLKKSNIDTIRQAPSAMPAMGERLSRTQLRDLIEFMTTLNGD